MRTRVDREGRRVRAAHHRGTDRARCRVLGMLDSQRRGRDRDHDLRRARRDHAFAGVLWGRALMQPEVVDEPRQRFAWEVHTHTGGDAAECRTIRPREATADSLQRTAEATWSTPTLGAAWPRARCQLDQGDGPATDARAHDRIRKRAGRARTRPAPPAMDELRAPRTVSSGCKAGRYAWPAASGSTRQYSGISSRYSARATNPSRRR